MTQTDNRQWEDVEISFHTFDEPNKAVEGELYEIDNMRMGDNTVGKYTVIAPDGSQVSFHGSSDLDQRMLRVQVGQYIKVFWTGEEKPTSRDKTRKVKVFKVQVARN